MMNLLASSYAWPDMLPFLLVACRKMFSDNLFNGNALCHHIVRVMDFIDICFIAFSVRDVRGSFMRMGPMMPAYGLVQVYANMLKSKCTESACLVDVSLGTGLLDFIAFSMDTLYAF